MTGVRSLAERQVAVTELPGGVRVSTVFLDLCAVPDREAPALQYETLILGGRHHDAGEQYATIDEARAGHELWVLVATGTLTPEAIHEMREVTAS